MTQQLEMKVMLNPQITMTCLQLQGLLIAGEVARKDQVSIHSIRSLAENARGRGEHRFHRQA